VCEDNPSKEDTIEKEVPEESRLLKSYYVGKKSAFILLSFRFSHLKDPVAKVYVDKHSKSCSIM